MQRGRGGEVSVRARGGDRAEAQKRLRRRSAQARAHRASSATTRSISVYTDGPFVDLCRGPHVPDTGRLKHFKLLHRRRRVLARRRASARCCSASTARRGSRRKISTRTSTASRRRRSATTAGSAASSTCSCSIRSAPGAASGRSAGTIALQRARRLRARAAGARRSSEIKTPLLYNKMLWEMSGHWGKYRENMFLVLNKETGEHDVVAQADELPVALSAVLGEEALVPRAAAPLRHLRRAAPERGDRRALGAHARAAVRPGRLPRLPDRGPDRATR